jgi:hypothetical protein
MTKIEADAATYGRAMKLLAKPAYSAAIEDLEGLADRGYRDSASQLAFALMKTGTTIEDFHRAERLLESFIASNKDDYHARKNLAYVKAAKTGDQRGALGLYQELLNEGYWECAHNVGMLAEAGIFALGELEVLGLGNAEEIYEISASRGHIFSMLALKRLRKSKSLANLIDYWTFRFLLAPFRIVAIAVKKQNDRRLLV